MKKQTPKQTALLLMIGVCVWFVALLLTGVMFSGVSEALRIQAGGGDSRRYAFSAVFTPVVIAVCVCVGLRLWKEYNEPD